MSAQIFLQYVCPGLGTATALLLFLSPLAAVRRVNASKQLGDMNMVPLAMLGAVCVCYAMYGYMFNSWFVFMGNISGVLLGFWYTLVCYKFAQEADQDRIAYLLLGIMALLIVVGVVDMAAALQPTASRILWGSVAAVVMAAFYASPLTTLFTVLSTRNSSSFHLPLCVTNAVNASLWFAFGLATRDWFVAVPQGLGAVLGLLCVAMCLIFPRTPPSSSSTGSDSGATPDGSPGSPPAGTRLPSSHQNSSKPETAWLRWPKARSAVQGDPIQAAAAAAGGGALDAGLMSDKDPARGQP